MKLKCFSAKQRISGPKSSNPLGDKWLSNTLKTVWFDIYSHITYSLSTDYQTFLLPIH